MSALVKDARNLGTLIRVPVTQKIEMFPGSCVLHLAPGSGKISAKEVFIFSGQV